jgi:hypothetical protein
VAAKGMIELYQAVKRRSKLPTRTLVFSVSRDNQAARMYGHSALIIEGKGKISFYRHLIHDFGLLALDGKEKWTAYQFTRNAYDNLVPVYSERICSAIDKTGIVESVTCINFMCYGRLKVSQIQTDSS